MKRTTKRIINLCDQLSIRLEKKIDLFIKQRPFLENKEIDPIILSRSDEKIIEKTENDIAIETITSELQKLL